MRNHTPIRVVSAAWRRKKEAEFRVPIDEQNFATFNGPDAEGLAAHYASVLTSIEGLIKEVGFPPPGTDIAEHRVKLADAIFGQLVKDLGVA